MLFILLQFDDLQKKYTYFGKEVRLKLLKKKIFKISSMTHYHFYSKKKNQGTKIEILRIVIMYFVDIFIIRRLLGTPSTISQC